VLRQGRNVWRLERAERLAFLVDGEAYYSALLRSLERARHSILVAAWEIDDQTRLVPDESRQGRPSRFGDVLRARLEDCPDLQVHVLAWDFAMIYVVERGLLPLFRLRFSSGPRLHLHLDGHHPVGASHHQKLVVVDDRVAFLGGLDITQHRWDRPIHRCEDPDRVDDEGNPYPPFHDVQVAVQGDAAAALGDLFRDRWRASTGRRLATPPPGDGDPPWPIGLEIDAEGAEVGLARTWPAHDGREEIREVERLYLDAIARARRSIYIENQYLTSASIVRALAERLGDPEGPEVVLVLPRRCPGWLEQHTVGLVRRRRLRELGNANGEGRLRVVHPHVPGVEDGVFVHAKVMVVDDVLARVGSANLSNRSMGFDSELDLALESGGDPDLGRTVSGLRDRLLAEHLGTDPKTVADRIDASNGSLIAALDELSSPSGRTLRPLQEPPLPPDWDEALELGQDLADPESPEEPELLVATFVARDVPEAARSPWVEAAALVGVLAVLAAAWHLTPLGEWLSADRVAESINAVRQMPLAPLAVAAVYVVASVFFFPVTALIVATAFVLPPLEGTVSALFGVLAASAATFGLGHLLGRGLVRRLAGRRVNELSRRVARRGLLAVAAVRLVPIAPFSLVNLVAGASHVGFRDFLLGTLLGMSPGVVGIILLEASLEELIRHPGWTEGLSAAAVLGALVAFVALVRRVAKSAR
jgi:phospholipase D1/2